MMNEHEIFNYISSNLSIELSEEETLSGSVFLKVKLSITSPSGSEHKISESEIKLRNNSGEEK